MALGARRADVLLMMLRQALLPVGLGLLAGIAIALAISRTFAGLLYGVTFTDPVTYVNVCLLLLAIAAVAAYIPARHATRVDPLVASQMNELLLLSLDPLLAGELKKNTTPEIRNICTSPERSQTRCLTGSGRMSNPSLCRIFAQEGDRIWPGFE